jgi:peptidoglycan-N-acetylglucosamine deacetylase
MNNKLILVTSWDDGHPLDLKIGALLSKYGLRGTFYIPARSSRSLLPVPEVRQLSRQFEIGAHGIDSHELTLVSDKIATDEIVNSKQWVEDNTGNPCYTFCFPKGRFRRKHLEIARTAGFIGVRTVALMSVHRPVRRCGLDIIGTTLQVFSHSKIAYFRNFAKRLNIRNACVYLKYANFRELVPAAVSLLDYAVRNGGVFHLWGHSWEIEETDQWGNLEQVLSIMSQYRQSAQCATVSEVCHNGR